MRPRHKAAENALRICRAFRTALASMRPRHKAAENAVTAVATLALAAGFNEAAA